MKLFGPFRFEACWRELQNYVVGESFRHFPLGLESPLCIQRGEVGLLTLFFHF